MKAIVACDKDPLGVHLLRGDGKYSAEAAGSPEEAAARVGPASFNIGKIHLDYDRADDRGRMGYREGEIVSAFARSGTNREIAPETTIHGGAEIGPKAEILANKRLFALPVAGRKRETILIHQVGVGRPGNVIDFFKKAIGEVNTRAVFRIIQGVA